MIEVLISILATTAFLMGTLQALLINAIYRVRAEREVQATFWVQEDVQKIQALAQSGDFNISNVNNTWCDSTTFDGGYGGKLRDKLYDTYSDKTQGTADFQVAAEKYLVKKKYRLVRIIQGTDGPYESRILKILYKVGEPDNSEPDKIKADNGEGFEETIIEIPMEVEADGTRACN
ncbi:MAG: hypothetical protein AB4058_12375 [Microcystaceae cyanobacterium]